MMKSFGPLSGVFTAPARGGEASSLILVMHGWGADANDLADLAYPMSLRFPGAAFFVPNAPEPCSMNPMGRQWFDLADSTAGPVAAGTRHAPGTCGRSTVPGAAHPPRKCLRPSRPPRDPLNITDNLLRGRSARVSSSKTYTHLGLGMPSK